MISWNSKTWSRVHKHANLSLTTISSNMLVTLWWFTQIVSSPNQNPTSQSEPCPTFAGACYVKGRSVVKFDLNEHLCHSRVKSKSMNSHFPDGFPNASNWNEAVRHARYQPHSGAPPEQRGPLVNSTSVVLSKQFKLSIWGQWHIAWYKVVPLEFEVGLQTIATIDISTINHA